MSRWIAFATLALTACSPADPDNDAATADTGEALPPGAADGDAALGEFLVGMWSYADNCENDHVVMFDADGALDDYGNLGSWNVTGGVVIQTVTARREMGEDQGTVLDRPEVHRFEITRIDDDHAVITVDGERYPMLRCGPGR